MVGKDAPREVPFTPVNPESPGAAFAAGAAAKLAPVERELHQVSRRASTGELRLDPDTAHGLLAALARLRARVHGLVAESGTGIDQPLRFGENVVGQAMSERLRGAATGGAGAAIPVLERFTAQLDKLEDIVSRAAGLITTMDEDASERIGSIPREAGEVPR